MYDKSEIFSVLSFDVIFEFTGNYTFAMYFSKKSFVFYANQLCTIFLDLN